jgi:hypothetical protein
MGASSGKGGSKVVISKRATTTVLCGRLGGITRNKKDLNKS